MAFLVIFTFLDTIVTRIGLSLGCVELNPFVNNLGIHSWSIFRILLLAYLLLVYFAGYKFLKFNSIKGLSILKNSLYAIDASIGAIVFSGIFNICSKILL
jgi:hypothetical protein